VNPSGPATILAVLTLSAMAAAPAAYALSHASETFNTTPVPGTPEIRLQDVTRFYQVYEAAGRHPTAVQLDRDYLAAGSAGLHEFARLRDVTGERIAAAIGQHPETYSGARRCLAVLPQVKRRLLAAFSRLASLYPEAGFPPVTLLVGRGRPVGITNPAGVSIGLEALCAADFMTPDVEDRFVRVITHEYGHIQQSPEVQTVEAGQPGVTVLRMSLIEGAAEFMADLISGDIANSHLREWTRGHEPAIDAAFVRDEDKTDSSDWLSNGPGTPEHPGDLGYWVGYQIVKSYYAHATDRRHALHDIFNIDDSKAFLAASGWRPATDSRMGRPLP
jgi:hypothetical protein